MHTIKTKKRLVAIVMLSVLLLSLAPMAFSLADAASEGLSGTGTTPESEVLTDELDDASGDETLPLSTRILRNRSEAVQPIVSTGTELVTTATTTATTTTQETTTAAQTTEDADSEPGLRNTTQSETPQTTTPATPESSETGTSTETGGSDTTTTEADASKEASKLSVTNLSCSPEAAAASVERALKITFSGLNGEDAPGGYIDIKANGTSVTRFSSFASGSPATISVMPMGWPTADGSYALTATYVPGENDAYIAGDSATATLTVEGATPEAEEDEDDGTLGIRVTSLSCTPVVDLATAPRQLSIAYSGVSEEAAPGGHIIVTANGSTIADITDFASGSPVTFDAVPADWPEAEDGKYTLAAEYVPGEEDAYAAKGSASVSTHVGEPAGGDNDENVLPIETANTQVDDATDIISRLRSVYAAEPAMFSTVAQIQTFAGASSSDTPSPGTNYVVTLTSAASVPYTGAAQTPTVKVTYNNGTELAAANYTVSPATDFITAGTKGIVVTGKNGHTFTNSSLSFTITKVNPTLSLAAEMIGTSLQVEATVSGTSGTFGGTVTFTIKSSRYPDIVKTANVAANGKATITQAGMTSAEYTISAVYSGDTNHNASSAVSIAPFWSPTVRLSITGTGSRGEYTTVLVTVTGSRTGYTPRGTVTLRLDGSKLTDLQLDSNGQATYTLWNYPWSREELIAYYNGDSTYSPARSNPLSRYDENKLTPTLEFLADVGTGSKVTTLTAVVSGSRWEAVPTGFVSFYSGNELLGTVLLNSYGEAVLTWKNVPNGTHNLQALYQGDDAYRVMSATKTITKRGSSSSSGGSGSGSSGTGTGGTSSGMSGTEDVLLRDINGSVLSGYDTTTITMQDDGILVLETPTQQDFYSYGFRLSRLNELSSRTNGYINIVTPNLNLHVPYDLLSGLEGLTDYISQNDLNQSQLELRLIVRSVSDSAIEAAYRTSYPDSTPVSYLRIEVALYSNTGKRLDYVPTEITTPLQLIIPSTINMTGAEWYDEQTRTFSPVQVTVGDNAMMLDVQHNGVYIIAQ